MKSDVDTCASDVQHGRMAVSSTFHSTENTTYGGVFDAIAISRLLPSDNEEPIAKECGSMIV